MQASADRILTTHAGSLPRPRALTALLVARSAGRAVDETELARLAEQATAEVLAQQISCGIDVVNNGEVGRESFFTYLARRMGGFSGTSQRPAMADLLRYPAYIEQLVRRLASTENVSLMTAPRATSAITYLGREPIDAECEQLRRLLAPHAGSYLEAFVSSPSPGIVAAAMENAFYDDLETYVRSVARALRAEYEAIVSAGFLLQIDAPDLAMERHTLFQGRPLSDFLVFVRTVVDALEEALARIPRERVRLHVCWGNYEGPHDLDAALEEIWPEIARARAGAFLVSLANPRHAHEAGLFARGILPDGALLVPGVIDTTTNYVEHPALVAERIERVADAIGDPARVLAGTDCGFETAAGFAAVAPDVVWAKLRALRDGAALASRRLF